MSDLTDHQNAANQLENKDFLAIAEVIEQGAGIPELLRAIARVLKASLALLDGSGTVLAIAARSSAEERMLLTADESVVQIDLVLADKSVGQLRIRGGEHTAEEPQIKLLTALIALELERVSSPHLASREAVGDFVLQLVGREVIDASEAIERAAELGLSIENGTGLIVARAHPLAPIEDDWRTRFLTLAGRSVTGVVSGSAVALRDRLHGEGPEVVVVVPTAEAVSIRRAAEAILRELDAHLPGFYFAIGISRPAIRVEEISRAADEACLAANVVEAGGQERLMEFEQTGSYRLLLPAMSENPQELENFYHETLAPIVAYDEQYETDLLQTLETFLTSDGNVAGTAAKLFTHRHTIRYRLERVRELTGFDISSSEGREQLSLGLKAMRVLGINAGIGPAQEERRSKS